MPLSRSNLGYRLMLTFVFCGALSLLSSESALAQQDQEVQLEIVSTGVPPVKLAVPALQAMSGAAEHARLLHEVLWNDLDWSMAFDLVDPRVYPGVAPNEVPPWPAWRASGARALITGTVALEGSRIVVELRIFDVSTGRQVEGRRYAQPLDGLSPANAAYRVRRIAHEFSDDAVLHYTGIRGVASTRIAMVSDRDAPAGTPQQEVHLMDADGERQRRLTFDTSIAMSPSFSPRADSIAYQSYRVRNGVPRAEIDMIFNTGGQPTRVFACASATNGGTNSGPAFSPDGTLVALSSSCSGNAEIVTVGADGSNLTQLTRNPGSDVSPAWSHNGRQIVFVSDRSGSQQLYLMDATGLNSRRLFAPGGQKDDPAWQPARGELIAFTASTGGNNFDIFLYDLTTDRVHQLTRGRGRKEAPTWSPDGRQIAFEWARDDSIQIWVMGLDGTRRRMLTRSGNNMMPAWGDRPQ